MWISLLLCVAIGSGGSAVEWAPRVEPGLQRAAEESRVVLLALGSATEARSERHVKDLYRSKAGRTYLAESVNLAAWNCPGDEVRLLPEFGGYKPLDHASNMAEIKERWLRPNASGVVALPQHVWLSTAGEVLLSVPYELDEREFAWCFDEALRRAGVAERPKLVKGAHPPRRLVLGDVVRLRDDDEYGRGLWPRELDEVLERLRKRTLSMEDAADVRRVLFTDEAAAADFIEGEFEKWDLVSSMRQGLGGILDGTVYLLGLVSTERFLPVLGGFTKHPRANLRTQVAAAYEQLGSADGLAAVKKALKKEEDDALRVQWVRALGACGRGDASVTKDLLRLASKDKVDEVRTAAILSLGYVLPEPKAFEALVERVASGPEGERRAALLGLGLGRAVEARELVAGLAESDADAETAELAGLVLAVLDGANLVTLREAVGGALPDGVDRRRVFFPSVL